LGNIRRAGSPFDVHQGSARLPVIVFPASGGYLMQENKSTSRGEKLVPSLTREQVAVLQNPDVHQNTISQGVFTTWTKLNF
jgi:hypothetical protein